MSASRWNRGGDRYVNQMWEKIGASAPPDPDLDSKQGYYGAVPGKGATGEGPVEAEVLVVGSPTNCYAKTPPKGMFDGFAASDIRGALGPSMTAIPIPNGNEIYLLYGYFWKTSGNIEKFGKACGVSKSQQPGGSPKHIGLRGTLIDARERASWRNLV